MTQVTFCGLTVSRFKSALGFGKNQSSILELDLVQDPANGDVADFPELGYPAYFEFYDFFFAGLLQKWEYKQDASGLTYSVVLTDPREILDGVQVIIGGFTGSVFGSANLINVYSYWENTLGFGASQSNDAGMPWRHILAGIRDIVNSPTDTVYGGSLNFRGVRYGLNLNELPVPDTNYRISGTGSYVNLLDAICQICDDAGYDFYVVLEGYNIVVKTINRRLQPPLGTITALTAENDGTLLQRSSAGLEVRNDNFTSSFLVGGNVNELHVTDSFSSFWGYDLLGNPIIGVPTVFSVVDGNGNLRNVNCEYVNLNSTPVADIIGSTTYTCTTLEMRFAATSYYSWMAFIESQRPDVARFIVSPFKPIPPAVLNANRKDIVKADAPVAKQMVQIIESEFWIRGYRLYEFILGYARDFYGKKFLVSLPFVLTKQDSETLQITFSQQIDDAGWYPETETPLGLSTLQAATFQSNDERYLPFVRYDAIYGSTGTTTTGPLDLSRVNPADSIIGNTRLYVRANVDHSIVFDSAGLPNALVTLSDGLFEIATNPMGDLDIGKAVLGVQNNAQIQKMQKNNFVQLTLWPDVHYPAAFAIPIKSNVLTYGPWIATGAYGKIRYEQDSSLVPWNYGGTTNMEAAANARVLDSLTAMQVSETGYIELVGPPTISMGDVLRADGPNLTNIDVQYGPQGITTTYRFATYTPRFGVFSKGMAERIRRAGNTSQELRRAIKQDLKKQVANSTITSQANKGFLAGAPNWAKKQTPHEMLVAYVTPGDVAGKTRVQVQTATYEDAITMSNADDNWEFQNTAIVSFEGVFHPYSVVSMGSGLIPYMTTPSGFDPTISSSSLNPMKVGNNTEVYTYGIGYDNLHAYRNTPVLNETRSIGLKGPVVIAGWGYDLTGKPTPTDGASGFLDGYLQKPDTWKVGPLDPLWDNNRGVWTVHDFVNGKLESGSIAAGANGTLRVYDNSSGLWNLSAWNWSTVTLPSGALVGATYSFSANKWYIVNTFDGISGIVGQERLLRGTTSTAINAGSSGTVTLTTSGSPSSVVAYNHFSSNVSISKNVLIGYMDRDNRWYVIGADC